MDTISHVRRSENMRRIRSQHTKPELVIRSLVHRLGFRFRLHRRDLPGRPDLTFPSLKRVIFVHGCFWHQHKRCADGRLPKSRQSYWVPKLQANVVRDKRHRANLKRLGWNVLVVWDCETADTARLATRLQNYLGR
ncbi:MAG TPA: DNA mismatch endonuclease Vsr [Candidatus Dormibacteraeota bacterium]|nr:DNA mismatch endonuclease Vsr [Candidatus Dormibacteraeota bacterium]